MFHLDSCGRPNKRRITAWSTASAVAAGALTLLMLTAAGCGTSDGGGGGGGGGDTESTVTSISESISHPAGGDQIVLQVKSGGGFVPVEYNLTNLPEFSLYGDGRVIVSGPVIAIYPPPALPNLQTVVIPEETVQALLSAAREAGLFNNGVDYGQPGITDVATTTFIVNAEGSTYQSDVYALGMEDDATGLTMEQQQARAAVDDFRSKLMDLTAFTTAPLSWATYDYKSLAVFSRLVDQNATTDTTDIMPGQLDWPLADLATLGTEVQGGFRRAVVSGEDLAALKQVPLDKATTITLWSSGDKEYHLYFRPLLPDEES
ncbi:MAG: hypothetical protein M1274_10135 [Actinobacteria bacterium]|nr:hypothetical protein [Actinomycetota bacterium]